LMAVLAAGAPAAVFEQFLSPDRPLDRAILGYLALDHEGKASSVDLADLGVLLLQKGFPKDAERYLKKALKADKHNYEASYRLGLVLQREGRDREAIKYYRRTLKDRPGHGYARFMLAMAEERCGRRAAAIQDYVRAYHRVPDLADVTKNPLVADSDLQTEAILARYREQKLTSTLRVEPIDPAAVKHMMAAKPTAAGKAGKGAVEQPAAAAPKAVAPTVTPTPAKAAPAPVPAAQPPAPAPAPTPPPAVERGGPALERRPIPKAPPDKSVHPPPTPPGPTPAPQSDF
jgi:tetratricopeptide (TPR) repeat protein